MQTMPRHAAIVNVYVKQKWLSCEEHGLHGMWTHGPTYRADFVELEHEHAPSGLQARPTYALTRVCDGCRPSQ